MSTTTPETITHTFTVGQRVRLRDGMTAQVGSPGTRSSLPGHIRTGVVRETPDRAGDLRIQWDGEAGRGPRWCHQSVLEPETPTPVVFAPGLRVRVKDGETIRLASGTDTTPPSPHANVRTGTVQGTPDSVGDVLVQWDGIDYDLWCHTEVLEPEFIAEPTPPTPVKTARIVQPPRGTLPGVSRPASDGDVLVYFPEMPSWSIRPQPYGSGGVYVLMLVEDAPTGSYATARERSSEVPGEFADRPSVWVPKADAVAMHAVFERPLDLVQLDPVMLNRWAPHLRRTSDQIIYVTSATDGGRTLIVSEQPFHESGPVTTMHQREHGAHGGLVGWHCVWVDDDMLSLLRGTLTDPVRQAELLQQVADEVEEALDEFRQQVKDAAVERARSNGTSQFMPKTKEMLEELGIDVDDIPDSYDQRVTATIMVPVEIEVLVPAGTDPGSYEIRDYITVHDSGDEITITLDHDYFVEDSEPEISSGTPDVTDYNVEDDE